jgi:hypothetical protein
MKNFLIFALLITYVHSPTYSLSKIKLSKGADFPVMGISHKHAPEGSPFVMEFQIHSKVYGTQIVWADEEDFHFLSEYKWWLNASKRNDGSVAGFYVTAWGENKKRIMLHRLIMGFPDCLVDHIDGNPLNCTRENLRLATFSENTRNMRMAYNNTSGFKGVHPDRRIRKNGKVHVRYVARIAVGNQRFHLGRFNTPEEAAKKYNEVAPYYHGEFARLNIL